MSDNPTSPLLGDSEAETEGRRIERPRSQQSKSSLRSKRSHNSKTSNEHTSLLSRSGEDHDYNTTRNIDHASPVAATSSRSSQDGRQSKDKLGRRWPTFIALSVLSLVFLVILGLGFAAPAVINQYARQAMIFEPLVLSVDSFTDSGVRVRIRGWFLLDASRVEKKPVRDLGRAATWIARAVESKPSQVEVSLPEYGNVELGTAYLPAIAFDIRDGDITSIDFIADLEPGDFDGIRRIAKDWLDGKLRQLRIQAHTDVALQSGIFGLGTQSISQELLFGGHDIPTIPQYNITKLNFHEVELSGSRKAVAADASVTAFNKYPVTFMVPSLGFDILVPDCTETESILLANATTEIIHISPVQHFDVNVQGIIRQLTETLTTLCPNSLTSPLDALLKNYIHGVETTVFVRGADAPNSDTPTWISDLMKSVTVPLPFAGHTFDGLIRDFSMADVHLGLPDPIADPDSPEARPRISATVKAVVNLPEEMNFQIAVSQIRANADVYYHDKKLGVLNLHEWQTANSFKMTSEDGTPGLAVESIIRDVPLTVTDDEIFAEVIQALVFGGKTLMFGVKATVDVETATVLGKFVVRQLPAEGKVPIKPLSGGPVHSFEPKVGSLKILETTKSNLLLEAMVNITNPTNYSATVPYVNINLLANDTIVGHATAENVSVVPGQNNNILVHAVWDPLTLSGKTGVKIGRELLSQYISGFNTTLTLQTHNGTIPTQPRLGSVLSSIKVKIPTPRLTPPKNPNHPDNDDRDKNPPRFIDDATLHFFSSTASFTLLSPLPHTTLFVTHINATALYNHTEPIGAIVYDLPFAVPPGATTSPRLPVDWSPGSVGYDAVKQALGGTLKVDANAIVGIKVGEWEEMVWYKGSGIGAHVRL